MAGLLLVGGLFLVLSLAILFPRTSFLIATWLLFNHSGIVFVEDPSVAGAIVSVVAVVITFIFALVELASLRDRLQFWADWFD